MFGLFNNKKEEPASPGLTTLLQETQERWFTFLGKLETRMEELGTAALPELREALAADTDPYKRTFLKMQSGVNGQFENIRQKAYDTYDQQVNGLYDQLSNEIPVLHPAHNQLMDFRNSCSDRYHQQFDSKYHYWRDQIQATSRRDLETEYRQILDEFEQVKNQFTCSQCGAPIAIQKIFFISTYLPCPSCQTQNSFEPGSQARQLQFIARDLAEQRTAHLHTAYEKENALEREYYHEAHTLKLSTIHEHDKKILAQKEAEMAAIEARRQESIRRTPELYRQYLRAMYDELNLILPDLKDHHEKMYQNQMNGQ
jgi:RNA polymerase-binding transcription factor DksA